jgi:hypothetical protein
MDIYTEAVAIAKDQDKWYKHPNKKKNTQKVATVKDLGSSWQSKKPEDDV